MNMPVETVRFLKIPRWPELPGVGLYMDQVVLIIEEMLTVFANENERVITPTMINNYVKLRVISPPERKKYSREHVSQLVMVSLLKRVLSMNEITLLLQYMTETFGVERSHDEFCARFEILLRSAFTEDELPYHTHDTERADALDAALMALIGKLLVESMLKKNG